MREAIGSSLLLNIAIIIIGIISAFLIGSIGYSKAYKVKNRIISIIDEYNGDCFSNKDTSCYDRIDAELTNMGYSSNISADCPDDDKSSDELKKSGILSVERVYPLVGDNSGHKYCVYKITQCSVKSMITGNKCWNSNITYYYRVYTFMHFDIPVISDFLEFKVSGESRSYYETIMNFTY